MLIALGIAAAVFLVLLGLRELVVRRLGKRAERTANGLDDLVVGLGRRTQILVIAVVALYAGACTSPCSPGRSGPSAALAEVAVFLQIALWSSVAIDFWIARQRRRMDQDPTSVALAGVLRFVAKLILWALLLLMALDNLGVNVTALITGLGVGGVAVALALQNVLSDLLASLSIVLDKPFVIGDAITVDTLTGTVESIGLKTTRLRAVSGEQLVFANSDLLKSRIHNWQRLAERRVVLAFGVPQGTPPDAVERIPGRDPRAGRGAGPHPLRPRPLQGVRRLVPRLRGGLLDPDPRLQRLHGPAAGDQPRAAAGPRARGDRPGVRRADGAIDAAEAGRRRENFLMSLP